MKPMAFLDTIEFSKPQHVEIGTAVIVLLQSEVVDTQIDLLEGCIARATASCIGTFSMRNRRIQTYRAA